MSDQQHAPERTAIRRRQAQPEGAAGDIAPPHPLVALGQQVGNARIARMLAQREQVDEEEELQMSRDPAVQREAVDEEEELQLSRDPAVQREQVDEEEELQLSRDPALQRDQAEEEDELQLSREGPEVGLEGGPVSDGTASRINSLRGGGSALDAGTRAQMEGALGDDFADVRVHTGGEAAQLNRSLGARAFTTGTDVFFGEGASPGDKGLLAHELTHVVQQRGMSGGGPLTVGPADDAYEAEAESTAQAVSAGAAPAQRKADDEAS